MSSKKFEDLTLHINLTPKRKLPLKAQSALWQKVLDVDFRTSIGTPRTDHIASGSVGESHVAYETETIDIIIYDRGVVTIEDEKFLPAHSVRIEGILNSVLRTIAQATHKRVDMRVTAYIHAVLAGKSIQRFLLSNIRFSPTRVFKEIFAPARISTFILRISDKLSIVFIAPSHMDFLYYDTVSAGTNRKAFVSKLTRTSMKYLESLRRRA